LDFSVSDSKKKLDTSVHVQGTIQYIHGRRKEVACCGIKLACLGRLIQTACSVIAASIKCALGPKGFVDTFIPESMKFISFDSGNKWPPCLLSSLNMFLDSRLPPTPYTQCRGFLESQMIWRFEEEWVGIMSMPLALDSNKIHHLNQKSPSCPAAPRLHPSTVP
jgi:hypothetical protein